MLKYLICISLYLIISKSMLEYGEFDLALTKVEMCNGPKRKHCIETKLEIVTKTFLKYDLLVMEDMKVIKAKIIGSVNDKELLRLQVKNVCNNVLLRPLFQGVLNETDRCGLFKGHYAYQLDIQKISRQFYGGKFMYGNWSYRILFLNDQCNMECATVYLSLTPKKSAIVDKH